MNRNNNNALGLAWKQLSITNENEPDRAMLYMEDPGNSDLIASTCFGRHDGLWKSILPALEHSDLDHISVLITAMSVGCEVYDASRIASIMGIENIHFYGHDISATFSEVAEQGIYPQRSPYNGDALDRAQDWFNLDTPELGYMAIRPELFQNVTILPPCDIRDLSSRFDVVVANVMNPPPIDLDKILDGRARHLSVGNNKIFNSSPEFAPVIGALRRSRNWDGIPKCDLPGDLPGP